MKYFWKLGIIGVIFTLLNFVAMEAAFAKQQSTYFERYDLPYASSAPATTTSAPAKKGAAPKPKQTTASHNAATATPQHSIYSKETMQVSRRVPPFSAIDISGPFKVDIAANDGRQRVVLNGNVNAVPLVTSRVIGNTLVIRMLPSKTGKLVPLYNPRVAIQINMAGGLSAITAGGNTQVYGAGLSSSGLAVTTSGQSSVYLRGNLVVNRIVCNSSGNIDIPLGHIRGIGVGGQGSGLIRITGSVYMLTAVLGGSLRLDASRLRAQQVYITTFGNACGEVLPVVTLNAFARDISNIYYFKEPQVIVGSSKGSGNILQLANWN